MKQEEFTTTIIEPDEGKFLTQVADVAPEERIISDKIALGRNDSPANWREITSEEAAQLRAEIEVATAAAMDYKKGGESDI